MEPQLLAINSHLEDMRAAKAYALPMIPTRIFDFLSLFHVQIDVIAVQFNVQ